MTACQASLPCPELLAPAGDWEALRAAVSNGADAVYFGLKDFNARHRAANFGLEELPEVMRFLHERNVRGYVAFNTLIFSDELPQAVEYTRALVHAGVDAVICQDLGLVRLIHKAAPALAIHGSTQMTLTEPRGLEWVRSLGVSRVILARELSMAEIARITSHTDVPVEVFVHGALCVAYSGQCLTSEALGGRSANRGQCAQACRQPYELIVDGTHRDLGELAYLLSPQDLAAYDLVPELARAGVCSLKIEGRLKSAQYVAATTQAYRAALTATQEQRPVQLDRQQELDLRQSFSRGFSPGFLKGVNHQGLVAGRFPKHRGVRLGVVAGVDGEGVLVQLDDAFASELRREPAAPLPVKAGDGLVFDEGHPEQDEQGGRVFAVRREFKSDRPAPPPRAVKGATHPPADDASLLVHVAFSRGAINMSALAIGSLVWRTDDPSLRKRMEKTYAHDALVQPTRLSVRLWGEPGEMLYVLARDEATGHTEGLCGTTPLAAADKHPLTRALVELQFGRLGHTPFVLGDVRLGPPEADFAELPVWVSKPALNELRRLCVERLLEARRELADSEFYPEALSDLRDLAGQAVADRGATNSATSGPALYVLVRSVEQLRAVLDMPCDGDWQAPAAIYCEFEDVRQYRAAVEECRRAGQTVALATPRIIKPGEEGLLRQVRICRPDAVLVRNLAALSYFCEQSPGLPLVGDYALNVANELTAGLFLERGLARLVPSYDLNLEQLQAMLGRTDPGVWEVVVHQHMPMFHMEHCVFSHTLSNGKDWHSCGRPCDRHQLELRDHVGEAHPLVADVGCRNTLFNAHAQSAGRYVPQLRRWGVVHFRVELLRETAAETSHLLTTYARILAGKETAPGAWSELQVLNQLGVTRGTLGFR